MTEETKFTAFDLEPGTTYYVEDTFTDVDGVDHPVKESWTYKDTQYDEETKTLTLNVEIDGKKSSFRFFNIEGETGYACIKYFSEYVSVFPYSHNDIRQAYCDAYPEMPDLISLYKTLLDINIEKNIEAPRCRGLYRVAAEFTDTTALKLLLKRGVKPDADKYGVTPFHKLAGIPNDNFESRNKDIYQSALLLLDAGVDPGQADDTGAIPYHMAALNGNYPFIQALVDKKARLGGVDNEGRNMLHLICNDLARINIFSNSLNWSYDIIKMLLESKSIDPEAKDPWGKTPRDYAVENNIKEIAALLSAGAPAAVQSVGLSLHEAVRLCDVEAVTTLLEAGADPNEITGEDKKTPLIIAFEQGYIHNQFQNQEEEYFAILKALIEHGADINRISGETGRNAVVYLFFGGMDEDRMKIFDFILAHGLEPNGIIDEKEDTCLHFACGKNYGGQWNYKIVKRLIRSGWDLNRSNKVGMTPLMYFAETGNEDAQGIAAFLIKNGADVNKTDMKGYDALMVAGFNPLEASGRRIAELVLDAGAESGRRNNRNESALDIAVQNKRETITKLLVGRS
jgi:ankyrin repeat protein